VALTANPNVGSAVGQRHFFSIDNEMVYWNFYLDFGPLNLGHVYRFCLLMNAKLKDPKLQDKIIYFYSAEHPHKRTNAVFLITAWLLLCKGKTPEEAFAPFKGYYLPFPPWVSAFASRCLHPIHFILLTATSVVLYCVARCHTDGVSLQPYHPGHPAGPVQSSGAQVLRLQRV
jgi:hypothetical protein